MMRGRLASLYRAFFRLAILAVAAILSDSPLAAEDFDWRNVNGQNWLTAVKNQFGGTCWDFAACGSIEAKYMLTRNDTSYQPDVSEQQINWETSPDMGDSVDGGQTWQVMDYFVNHGVVLESEIPTVGTDNRGGSDPWLTNGWQNRVFRSTADSTTLAQGTNLGYIKSCLKLYGPMTIHLEADSDFYPNPGADRGGHQVVLVGYHDNLPGENAPGGGYWIVKNSWGLGGYNSYCGPGYDAIPYGAQPSYEDYSWIPIWPVYNRDISALTGQVYFTGAMATVTWKGGSGVWTSGGGNWSGVNMYGASLPTYTWENKETSATFNASSGTNVWLSGKVIAHGLTINPGATGYVFNGINNPSLTVTAGGITAHEDVVINAPVTIGAPQTWTVADGKWLTIGGDVHTIISALTVNGPGRTVIDGSTDGGGAINAAGASPGNITIAGGAYLYLRGPGGTNYYVNTNVASGGLVFQPPTGTSSDYYGVISGGGWIDKWGGGTAILSNNNTYSNWTSIYDGAIQADSGVGLPSNSFLNLNGGVLQSNAATTFTRGLGTSGANKFQWNENGGGFSAGSNPLTVTIPGVANLDWGVAVGSGIMGTLKFGSSTSDNVTTLTNNINLNGNDRTVYVEDNANSPNDRAVISGSIVDISGPYWAGLIKTGPGRLILTGANNYGDATGYGGYTTVNEGVLEADRDAGLSPNSGLVLGGGVLQSHSTCTFTDPLWYWAPASRELIWNAGGFSAGGGKMTVNLWGDGRTIDWGADGTQGIAGTMKLSSRSAQYETEIQNGINLNGTVRTIQVDDNPGSDGDFATISGAIADGSGPGGVNKTGSGRLVLSGNNSYSGGTTVNGGTLVLRNATNAAFLASTIANYTALEFNNVGIDSNYSGVIAGSGPSLTKTGSGSVTFSGSASNTYSGTTIVAEGTLVLAKSNAAVAVAGNVLLTDLPGGGSSYLVLGGDNQIAASRTLSFNNPNAWGHFDLNGHTQTLAGINDTDTWGVIEGRWDNTGLNTDSVLIVNNATASTFNGTIRDKCQGTGAGRLKLVKGGTGTLVLSGPNSGGYTGGLTINAGTLDYSGGTLPSCAYTIAGGTLNTGALSQSIGAFQITGGTVTGTGTLTSSSVYDLRAGTVDVALGGVKGLYKGTAGTVSLTRGLPGGGYIVSGGVLNLNSLSQSVNLFQLSGGTVSGSGTITSSSRFDLRSGTINVSLDGGAGLNKTTSGTVSLSKYLPGGDYTVADGTLNLGSYSKSIGAFRITGGTVTGSAALSSSATYDIQAGMVNSILSGIVGLTKSTGGSAKVKYPMYSGTTNVQAGTLTFTGWLPSGNYAISGGMLDAGSLSKTIGTLQITGGTLSGTGMLTGGSAYDVQAGTVNVKLAGASIALNKTSFGTAILNGANTYAGRTTVASGTLELGPSAQNAVFALGGANIQGGEIVFDYNGISSPAATIARLLTASYHAGLWDVGQFRSSTAATNGLTLGWFDDGASDVTVMSTYAGDFNLDGVVDTRDLDIWKSNAGIGSAWQMGDANYDGLVNILDLDLWKAHVGLPSVGGNHASGGFGVPEVPEPGTLALLAVGVFGVLAYARKKRK